MFTFEEQHYVNTMEKLDALDAHLMDGDSPRFKLLAYDTETSGLLFFKNVVIGFAISSDPESGYYVPLLEWEPNIRSEKVKSIDKVRRPIYEDGQFVCVWTGRKFPENVTPEQYQAPEFIKMFLARWLTPPEVELTMYNAPFDCNFTQYNLGVDLAPNLWLDTILLSHALNENEEQGLKKVATRWSKELGFSEAADAAAEQRELGETIIRNGGKFNAKNKHVWRGNPYQVAKYGAKDTALTFGVAMVGLQKFEEHFTPEHFDWFFKDEVMPVCREVVIPMRYGGVYISIPHFEKLKTETMAAMDRLEEKVQAAIAPYLADFSIGASLDEAVSKKRFHERVLELEGLTYPTIVQKGVVKNSLAKKALEGAYQSDPHWFWGYLLGNEELRYSPERVMEIKNELYLEVLGRRYRFNINSADHLRWLFCEKLGYDRTKLPQTDSATKENPIPSMGAEVLEEYFLKDHPWVRSLMQYKRLDKLFGTYILPALELNNKGWLHMDMKQWGTVSGRFACSGGFNLQTLPKVEELDKCPKCGSKKISIEKPIELLATLNCQECGHVAEDIICPSAIKAGFIAPPGYKIINADYSSLEPRCFAFMSGDEKLKQIYREDLDIYSKVYCDMLDHEGKYSAHPDAPNALKKVNKSARDLFKPVVLGIPYGARGPQVANLMNLKVTKKFKNKETGELEEVELLDVEKGWEYLNLYLRTYPNLHRYMETRENECVTQGFVETIVGRRRHFQYAPEIYKTLQRYNVDIPTFLDAKYKSMEGESVLDGALPKIGLERLATKLNIPYWKVVENGGWNYIRNLFKNEYNNAKNCPIQGLAGHITNRGMLDTQRLYRANHIDGYVALQVHDEITSYARADQAEQAAQYQKQGMEKNIFALKVDVPMQADPVICDNLKDSK